MIEGQRYNNNLQNKKIKRGNTPINPTTTTLWTPIFVPNICYEITLSTILERDVHSFLNTLSFLANQVYQSRQKKITLRINLFRVRWSQAAAKFKNSKIDEHCLVGIPHHLNTHTRASWAILHVIQILSNRKFE